MRLQPKKDVTGEKINGILMFGYVSHSKWRVVLKCGCTDERNMSWVKASHTGMCEKHYKEHRLRKSIEEPQNSNTQEYKSWLSMRSRCYAKYNNRHHLYGAKGIRVCDRWHNFENFKQDMGPCPDGYSIERIDITKDYSPSNCVWASSIAQANNKSTNILIENSKGECWSLKRWCVKLGLDYKNAWYRLKTKGLSIEEVLGKGYNIVETRNIETHSDYYNEGG